MGKFLEVPSEEYRRLPTSWSVLQVELDEQRQQLFDRETDMSCGDWGVNILEEGREEILEWREKRLKKQSRQKQFHGFTVFSISLSTLHSFIHNFNYMVILHMAVAGLAVYLAKLFNLSFDIQLSLLISPIVFPLAFSINADFQRRDTVLEYIAHFESSGMVLYLCLREWRKDTGLTFEWINAVHDKIKSILFLLREYLFTTADENRKFILRAIYEDISDTNQMIEQMRTSKLQPNGPLLSRVIHLLSLMCLAFERLRVVKEYRSPRSIRAFNKVLIMLLPIIMAPYFVFHGKKNENEWSPYFLSVLVAFVFSALQGVQDKLDDPFDGMGEDDIKLNAIDEWTFDSFDAAVQRFNVGRFNVSVNKGIDFQEQMFLRRKSSYNMMARNGSLPRNGSVARKGSIQHTGRKASLQHVRNGSVPIGSSRNGSVANGRRSDSAGHPYRDALEKMKPNQCIKNGNSLRRNFSEGDVNRNKIDLKNVMNSAHDGGTGSSSGGKSIFTQVSELFTQEKKCTISMPVSSPEEDINDIMFRYSDNDDNGTEPNISGDKSTEPKGNGNENETNHTGTNIIDVAENTRGPEDGDNYTNTEDPSVTNEKFYFEKIDSESNKVRNKSPDQIRNHDNNNKENDKNQDGGPVYLNEKTVNQIKRELFRISPIHEETESDRESSNRFGTSSSPSTISPNDSIDYDIPSPPTNQNTRTKPLPNINQSANNERPRDKIIYVNCIEDERDEFTQNASAVEDTKIDMTSSSSNESDVTPPSSVLVKDKKLKLLRRENDFTQTNDGHSRLS